jgi:hypothetical protein
MKNGSETDIDCGGSCPKCVNGKACVKPSDCASGKCEANACAPLTFGLAAAVAYATDTFPNTVVAGDFNGDQRSDLALASSSYAVDVLLANPNGTFQPNVTYKTAQATVAVAMADFNLDGNKDVVAAVNDINGPTVTLLGDGKGGFARVASTAQCGGEAFIAIDFDLDGKVDLVGNDLNGGVHPCFGLGNGMFKMGTAQTTIQSNLGIGAADFNGDTKVDLAVAGALANNNVDILFGDGKGNFQDQGPFSAGNQPESLVVDDFNGDQKRDLAVPNSTDNNVSVFLGKGDGTFAASGTSAVGNHPKCVATGDLDKDGHRDLVVGNANSNNISVLLGKGDGTFLPTKNFNVGKTPYSVAVGDFNGDGLADVAVANFMDGSVSVLLNTSQ